MPQPSFAVLRNRLLARARFRHMEVLVLLATTGSVKRTADKIGMTQPGVTQMLSDLEDLVGTPLFERHAKGVRPTDACADLVVLARQTLAGVNSAAASLEARQGGGQGCVRVAATSEATHGLLAAGLAEFMRLQPDVQVQLRDADIEDVLLAVSRGEVDLAACRQPAAAAPSGWTFEPLLQDRFVLACAAGHPLLRHASVAPAHLAEQLWLPGPTHSAARGRLMALAEELGFQPRMAGVLARSPAVNWWLMRRTGALALMPYSAIRPYVEAGQLACLPVDLDLGFEPIGLLLPPTPWSEAASRLVACLQASALAANPALPQLQDA